MKSLVRLCVFALCALSIGAVHADSKRTPTSDEMTPQKWRTLQLAAADRSDKIMQEAQRLPGLLAQYAHMQLSYDTNDERAFQLIFGQYLSWYQTYIGDYDAARTTFSIAQPPQPDDAPSPLGGGYAARPATEVILDLAKDRKAVFFNEAHSAPITRTLTIELLAKLREQGYTHFAAETLYDTDAELNQRGYPTAKTGFYTNEPLYAEMVRSALRLGYKVVAYDVEKAGVGDPRERAGAERLYEQVFKKNPGARLVVNAGFAHVQKSGKYLGGNSMGEFFRKISGIDPLTIEQTMLIEHARPDQDHPIYRAAIETLHPRQPIVFVGGDGKPWTLKPGQYDMSVLFPARESGGERPAWAALDGLRQPYHVTSEFCSGHFPCLVEARYASEGADAIAADRIVLNVIDEKATAANRILSGHGTAQGRLYLRPGRYVLTASDRSGRALATREVVVGGAPS